LPNIINWNNIVTAKVARRLLISLRLYMMVSRVLKDKIRVFVIYMTHFLDINLIFHPAVGEI